MSSVCSNCGRAGHFFRECREPITSLGILAFKRPTANTVQWLLIRRRVSIGFIEIMRGKYELRDLSGIQLLIDQTTLGEREQLATRTFADLWRDLWNGAASRRYNSEYEQAKVKFELLRGRGAIAAAIRASTTTWAEPEWGFPKGRRSSSESEIECALRETFEEAGVRKQDLRIAAGEPLLEEYRGSNGISYRHRYWLAEAPPNLVVRMDPTNIDQRREISDVRWCTYDEAMGLIRDYNIEKRSVLAAGAARLKITAPQQRNERSTGTGTGTGTELHADLSGNEHSAADL
jgi:8-oxo-dGTP pyrophosphatase MutT (NUDIX family)